MGAEPQPHNVNSLKDEDIVSNLPGSEETWQRCEQGLPSQWPDTLRELAPIIGLLSHPAAIFWGEQAVLFFNSSWVQAGGIGVQGEVQLGILPTEVEASLLSCLRGRGLMRIRSEHLLRAGSGNQVDYAVVSSPIFDEVADEGAIGVLIQLLNKSNSPSHQISEGTQIELNVDRGSRENAPTSRKDLNTGANDLPLDNPPFFHRFAEMLPNGLAILDHEANAIFVNQRFYDLTTHQEGNRSFASWPQSIHPDDYEEVMKAYHEAFRAKKELRKEFRSVGEENPWRLFLLTPLADEHLTHGTLRKHGGFMCGIVDITCEKAAEFAERKAAEEARERKEQQERFIDMISHEIRNPLSAMLHCTEDIATAIQPKHGDIDSESVHQAIETINMCITHQRNIVDDVLSFSKLDSSMLTLAPKPCQPAREFANSLKMFEPEFRKQDISFDYCIDESYRDDNVSWVMADLARTGQILVNLITNAIKFTAGKEGSKQVTISVASSTERPTSYPPNVVFFNSDTSAYKIDATNTTEWGSGETLFLMIAVKDTGIGISDEGQKRLFERFQQATPRTGEVYGGSGLGLNISRKLCHLHGGEIGVASQEGSGSTFGFFIKVKRAESAPKSSSHHEKERQDQEVIKEQIDAQGLTSPDELDRRLIPQSLESPPVKRVEESARLDSQPDQRYEQTAEVVSRVKKATLDPIVDTERPHSSNEQRSNNGIDRSQIGTPTDGPKSSSSQLNGRHVLLAEDNIINQRILSRKLQRYGLNVTTANNGREAVDAIRNIQVLSINVDGVFDVILMDQEMPIMDGNTATREIRHMEQLGELNSVPILGVTANVRAEQQADMLASGMDDVISKPYKMEELIAKINKLLGSSDEP